MAAMRFEQVQRFILVEKKLGLGALLSTVFLKMSYHLICSVQINTLLASLQSLIFLGKQSSSRVLFMLVKNAN